MKPIIPFVGEVDKAEELEVVSQLQAHLPEVSIVPFSRLSENAKGDVEIAIVANPDPAELKQFPNLKWVHSIWAGVERMMAELSDLPIEIVRLVDPELSSTMAEAALAWTLYLHRDMPGYARQQMRKEWRALPYRKADQITVGILGLGELGKAAAERLRENKYNVVGWSRNQKNLSGIETYSGLQGLKGVLSRSDIVIILLPLTPETQGRLDASTLGFVKERAGIINFARGPIIDSSALLEMLGNGQISHAVLDVFDPEPLPQENPIWEHPDITVLPHISAPTGIESAALIVSKNIKHYLQTGEMPQTVDRLRGY